MQLIYEYGFSVDADTKRVYLDDGKVIGFNQSIPQGSDGITKGSDKGDIVGKTAKVGYNDQLNLVYNDVKGKPYTGKVTVYADLPHDEAGKLLVDTVGEIKEYRHGLAFTVNGAVAMDPTDSLDAPVLNAVYSGKTSLVFDFDSTAGEEAKYYTGYAVGGGKTFSAEVYDPNEDLAVQGLTEGTKYTCYVIAISNDGQVSPKSNSIDAVCKTVIKAPVFKSCVAGDGFATVTYDPVVPPEPFTVDHYAYSAVNLDDKDSPEVEGHIEDGKILLPNDITWYVSICVVCNPARIPSDFSDALTVRPEKPTVPYKPIINTCYAQNNGQIVVQWSKGSNAKNSTSASTVDSWKVKFHSTDGKGTDFAVDVPTSTPTSITSEKVNIGSWDVSVIGYNEIGASPESSAVNVRYSPTAQDPLVGGTPYDDGVYKYCVFNSNATTGYEATRTKEGEDTEFEVLLVGAGGAGKSQTVLGAKGGDGGGGQLVIGKLPANYAGSVFVTVPNGGTPAGYVPENTTVKEASTVLIAIAGKNATDKNDATGYPFTEVPKSWQELSSFRWFMPESFSVGGVVKAGEQDYPNGMFFGQAGAGTKDSKSGKGKESFVAIRWKK